MLYDLKIGQRMVKLLALLGVVHGALVQDLHATQRLRRQCENGVVGGRCQQVKVPNNPLGGNANII